MKYGSVCSGIEAASVAWESFGWQAQWYSEIEHFPSAVLAHRFPTVPNLGDMTLIHNTEHFNGTTIDLLVGGTPCQSFSVAGLRKGLDDTRGQLMLTFCELAARKRPRWVVWENVPGVLSSNKGEDLASFLGLLTGREIHPPVGGWKNSGVVEGIGSAYGVAWTVLDAQHFGVAQRRRRIFAIGYLGDWRPAAAVLFEHYRLSGDIKEGRKKRKATSADAEGSVGGGGLWPTVGALCADTHPGAYSGQDAYTGRIIPHAFKVRGGSETETGEQGGTPGKKAGKGYLGSDELAFTIGTTQDQQIAQPIAIQGNLIGRTEGGPQGIGVSQEGNMYTLTKADVHGVATPVPFRKAKRAQSKDDHETWEQDEKTNTLNAFDTGDIRTTQAVVHSPIAYENHPSDSRVKEMGETCSTVTSKYGTGGGNTPLVAQPIAFQSVDYGGDATINLSPTLRRHDPMAVAQPIAVDTYNQTTSSVNQTIKSPQGGLNESIGVVLQPIAVDTYNQTINEHTTQTIGSSASDVNHYGAVLMPQAIDFRNQNLSDDVTGTLQSKSSGGYSLNYQPGVLQQNISPTITQCKGSRGGSSMEALDEISAIHAQQPAMAIRRLLPSECEILQGFPKNWTLIPYRNKPAEQCPDGPRYKACGNSMAVPVMRWIGERIQMVEDVMQEQNGRQVD